VLISTATSGAVILQDNWVLLCISSPSDSQNKTTSNGEHTRHTQVAPWGPEVGDFAEMFYLYAHADFWQTNQNIKGYGYTRLPIEDGTAMWQTVAVGAFTQGPKPGIAYGPDQTIGHSLSGLDGWIKGVFSLGVQRTTFTASQVVEDKVVVEDPNSKTGTSTTTTKVSQIATAEWQFIVVKESYAQAYKEAIDSIPVNEDGTKK